MFLLNHKISFISPSENIKSILPLLINKRIQKPFVDINIKEIKKQITKILKHVKPHQTIQRISVKTKLPKH